MDTARKHRPQPMHRRQRRPPTEDVPAVRRGQRRAEKIAPVMARIREDARLEPKRWIDESEVKAGGE